MTMKLEDLERVTSLAQRLDEARAEARIIQNAASIELIVHAKGGSPWRALAMDEEPVELKRLFAEAVKIAQGHTSRKISDLEEELHKLGVEP